MDWQKLNMDEVIYYCKSFDDVGFDCSPFSLQMEEIVIMFSYYGIERFTVDSLPVETLFINGLPAHR